MTLLIRRNALVLLVLFSIGAAVVPAAAGFAMLREAAGLPASDAKILAERALFAGVVSASIMLLTLVVIMARVYRLSTALSRIADLQRVGGYDVEPALERLGEVGGSIARMYGQLNELSARKSTRIAAMNALLNVIMARSPQRLLVVDPRGAVSRATPAALEFLDQTAGAVLGEPVDSVIPDVNFARARAAIGRSGDPWKAEKSSFPVAVQPVLNELGEVGYFVYYLGPEARLVARTDPARDQPDAIAPEDPPLPAPPGGTGTTDGLLARVRRFLRGRAPGDRPR
jgi:PAS domain-containing protein